MTERQKDRRFVAIIAVAVLCLGFAYRGFLETESQDFKTQPRLEQPSDFDLRVQARIAMEDRAAAMLIEAKAAQVSFDPDCRQHGVRVEHLMRRITDAGFFNPVRVDPAEELMDAVWPGLAVCRDL